MKQTAVINKKKCAACGECAWVCPRGAIKIIDGCFAQADASLCAGCGLCARNCPAGCIQITSEAQ